MPPEKPLLHVVGALVRRGDRVLIAQRPASKAQALLWEFPGGKIEPGESPEEALAREIHEELGVVIRVGAHVATLRHDYGARVVELACYWAEVLQGEPHPHDCHALAWVTSEDMRGYTFAPADVPLVEDLRRTGFPPLP